MKRALIIAIEAGSFAILMWGIAMGAPFAQIGGCLVLMLCTADRWGARSAEIWTDHVYSKYERAVREADATLAKTAGTGEKPIPWEDVKVELGL